MFCHFASQLDRNMSISPLIDNIEKRIVYLFIEQDIIWYTFHFDLLNVLFHVAGPAMCVGGVTRHVFYCTSLVSGAILHTRVLLDSY